MMQKISLISLLFFTGLILLVSPVIADGDLQTADEHYLMGNAFSSFGQYKNATAEYKEALRLNPDLPDVWNNLGITLSKMGRYEEALDAAKNATSLNPSDAEAWYNLGYTYGMLGRYNDEIASYEKAISIQPDMTETWRNMGVAYFDLGEYDKAVDAFMHVVSDSPESATAWYYLGTIYEKAGNVTGALSSYEKAMTLNENLTPAKERIEVVKANISQFDSPVTSSFSEGDTNSDKSGLLASVTGLLGL